MLDILFVILKQTNTEKDIISAVMYQRNISLLINLPELNQIELYGLNMIPILMNLIPDMFGMKMMRYMFISKKMGC